MISRNLLCFLFVFGVLGVRPTHLERLHAYMAAAAEGESFP